MSQRAPAGSSKSQLHDSRTSVGERPAPNVPAAGRPSPTTPANVPCERFSDGVNLFMPSLKSGPVNGVICASRSAPSLRALPVAERPQHHRDVARAVGREDAHPLRVGPADELALADPGQREAGAVGALPAPARPAHRDLLHDRARAPVRAAAPGRRAGRRPDRAPRRGRSRRPRRREGARRAPSRWRGPSSGRRPAACAARTRSAAARRAARLARCSATVAPRTSSTRTRRLGDGVARRCAAGSARSARRARRDRRRSARPGDRGDRA